MIITATVEILVFTGSVLCEPKMLYCNTFVVVR